MVVHTRRPINTNNVLHKGMVQYWEKERNAFLKNRTGIQTRFDREIHAARSKTTVNGDLVLERVTDLFYNGMGRLWSEVQGNIFEEFINACLPLIYGDEWPEHKARVLAKRNLDADQQFVLVNMARRNGKTFVTSGTAAALMLCVPSITIAIFSTCRRTSQMMMSAIMDQLESAFNRGTHVTRDQFSQVSKNMEQLMYEGPDGTRRLLMSLPGSVRVSCSLISFDWGGGGVCPKKSEVSLFRYLFQNKNKRETMNFIRRMFGDDSQPVEPQRRRDAPPVRNAAEMVTDTQKRVRAMEMQKNQLVFRSNKLDQEAREAFEAGRKERAISLKKQQKQLESQIKMMDGQLFNLNQQVLALQSASSNVEMAKLMRSGTDSMQTLVKEVQDLDVEDVADELREAMEESHELGRALSEPMIMGTDMMDDDDILAEMANWDTKTAPLDLVLPDVETYSPPLLKEPTGQKLKDK